MLLSFGVDPTSEAMVDFQVPRAEEVMLPIASYA